MRAVTPHWAQIARGTNIFLNAFEALAKARA